MEEGGITPLEPPVLQGVFFNSRVSRRDHVVVFVVRAFRQEGKPRHPAEIVDYGFFARDALPPTRRAGPARGLQSCSTAPRSRRAGDLMAAWRSRTTREES